MGKALRQGGRTRDIEQDGLLRRRSTPFQDLHAQLPTRRLQVQAQRCGRSLDRKPRGTEAEGRTAALARRHLQAAQAVARQSPAKQGIEPEQRGRNAATAQGFDTGPEGIARAARKHQAQAVERDAGHGPGRSMGHMRRRHQHHGLPGGGQRGQRRQQEAEFADAFAIQQQFGQGPARPAAARQFGIEPRETAGKGRRRRHGESVAAPDVGALQDLGE